MIIKDYIVNDYPVFGLNAPIEEARETGISFGYSHVFLTDDSLFLGALSLSSMEDSEKGTLKSLENQIEKFTVLEDENILDSVRLFHTFTTTIVPIVEKNGLYLGYITFEDVFTEFSKSPLFSENGAVLSIQTNSKHYSIAEIAQIVESNNAKIFGCYVSMLDDENITLTLKINNHNLSSIDESLERYGYTILHKHYDDEKEELLKDRMGFLQKYLDF